MSLTKTDLTVLESSWITPEWAERAKLRRVGDEEGGLIIGRTEGGKWAGVVFPYIDPETGSITAHRLRRDSPEYEVVNGERRQKNKYMAAPGARNKLYFPPGVLLDDLQDNSIPITICEGEKKTLSLMRLASDTAMEGHLRFLPVGMSGAWNWKGKVGTVTDERGDRVPEKGVIADFDRIHWVDRRVNIFLDANANDGTNQSISAAQTMLAKELTRRGAIVHIVVCPKTPGVNGPDDLLHLWGPDRVLAIIENAEPFYAYQKNQSSVVGDPRMAQWVFKSDPAEWKLLDLAEVEDWNDDPLEWSVDPIIPKRTIGFLAAAPKTGKSLWVVDLLLHLATGLLLLFGKFKVEVTKTLYICREDPARRLKARLVEFAKSYGIPLGSIQKNTIKVLVRETLNLLDPEHLQWLKSTVEESGCEFVVLDVLNRMIPGVDDGNVKEMSQVVSLLEGINRKLNVGLLLVDHTRKPSAGRDGKRNQQDANPFDLKGSVAKYGCADYMIVMATTPKPRRLKMYCEAKDHDTPMTFFVDYSKKDEVDPETGILIPKFRFAGDVEEHAHTMAEKGAATREAILKELENGISGAAEIAKKIGKSRQAVLTHLSALEKSGEITVEGHRRGTKYFTKNRQDRK